MRGKRGLLTLITSPARFGKTTLLASCVVNCGMPVAWLSLDKDDNQTDHFLSYLIASVQEAGNMIRGEATQLLDAAHRKPNAGTRKAGRREIRRGQGTLDQLAAHREERQIQRKLSGDRWEENNQVFPNTLGKTMACKGVKGLSSEKTSRKKQS